MILCQLPLFNYNYSNNNTEMATFLSYTNEKSDEFNNIQHIKDIANTCSNDDIKIKTCNDRSIFYKKPIKKNNSRLEVDFNDTPQEIRRQQLLQHQKKNRNESLNAHRKFLEDISNYDDEEEIEVDQDKGKQYKVHKCYRHILMLSEWMLEVPQDFVDKWIMVPCPLGKRVLIVACRGLTKMYTRKGLQISVFQTMLPGGSRQTYKNNYTILDCIWLKNKKICYVLDVLTWSNQEMLNCEAEFRFFWLRSQLEDLQQLKEQSMFNDCEILALPTVTCDQNFYDFLKSISASILLDGLLFYHKEAHYVSGRTPLVNWLKTYMLPEVLSMNVPEPYNEKPNSYINFEHHVLKVIKNENEKVENSKRRKKQYENVEEVDMQ